MNFAAIDFETATGQRHSACAVGIVSVRNGKIVDEYYSLIRPPDNYYSWRNTAVHGITARHTMNAPSFPQLFPYIAKRLQGVAVVAHNESFDRSVLMRTMEHYGMDYEKLLLPDRWDCTLKIYRDKGFEPARLNACCERLGIELDHHDALSDARACAKLYLRKDHSLNNIR